MENTQLERQHTRTGLETVPALRPRVVPVVEGCLHELFEAQVDAHPFSPALIDDRETLSYQELDQRANQLARTLRFYGAGPGKLVGLYCERSASPILAILACLKAGAAYIPIDPVYPADRIRHILAESELNLLLTEHRLAPKAAEFFSGVTLSLDALGEETMKQPTWRLSREDSGVHPSDLCYVIYTSGTTGRPKGVMTEHRNAYRFALAFNEICGTERHDRIYQGFSLGFDGSVEEIWMAFSNGAALVVGDRNTPRFGNDLAQFLTQRGVTYFSTVPTLLSTMSEDVPTLKHLVVSGEICPSELVSRWARPGRRMLNVYGPTEATVNTTSKDCLAGQPVTIGRPLRGYDAYILDEMMRPVEYGEKGELYIGGDTLARGYLKQPGLTAEKFVPNPFLSTDRAARLYRTGDLVRFNDEGELEFFGRIDGQVKIRGFRVELAEIESVLLENPRIRSASVRLIERDGLQELAAYVLVNSPAMPLDRVQLLEKIEQRLPDYMIPGYLDVLEEFPMLTSGKVDRKQLPAPVSPLVRSGGKIVEPATSLEKTLAAVWAKIFRLPQVSVEDDFFLDLGGHSLVAAQMVTLLRAELTQDVAVRDAYRFPTIRKLAAHLEAAAKPSATLAAVTETAAAVFARLSRVTRLTTSALQAASLYAMYAIPAIPAAALFLCALSVWRGQMSLLTAFWWGTAVALGTWPVLLVVAVLAKWLIIGRYRAGEYPLWGAYYFRWWLATRLQALSGIGMFTGTPLLPFFMRLMGAKVGKRCTLDSAMGVAWDLLSIGDETSIGADTQFLGYRVENGKLILGRVDIGSRCFVGIHSAFGLNARMEDDSRLDDQSLLPDHGVIAQGEARRGSPAQVMAVAVPEPMGEAAPYRPVLFGVLHFITGYALGIALGLPALAFLGLYLVAYLWGGLGALAATAVFSIPAGVVVYCFYLALLKKLILPKAKPGIYPVHSLFYLRKWLCDELMKVSRMVLLPLYTTMYLPPWLRLMGAKIGKRAEMSTVWYCSPEMLDVAEESFFADGSILGGKRFFRGRFEIGINHIGRRTFVGNSAILPMGASLGDKCLLGVLSAPPSGDVADGTEWLGSPSFALPNRQKVGHFNDEVTFRPTAKLYAQRAVIDALRIVIPGFIALFDLIAGLALFYLALQRFGVVGLFLLAPLIGIALGLADVLAVVVLKKAVMGRFQPVIKPLWSMYVWLNEMVNGAYESVMAPALVPFLGTPFIAPLLRLIGCRIGKHAFIESTLFSEFDLVEVGDYAALNAGAIIQTHLFEDRVMKSSSLKIGEGATVGNMGVVLYDAEMHPGAWLGPLSLLMKGEALAAHGRSHGIPTVQVPNHQGQSA